MCLNGVNTQWSNTKTLRIGGSCEASLHLQVSFVHFLALGLSAAGAILISQPEHFGECECGGGGERWGGVDMG